MVSVPNLMDRDWIASRHGVLPAPEDYQLKVSWVFLITT